ncbi:MAG: Exonuclease, RNase and polymerase [Verrucomicrobiales bacterium]|nr:Exonuclease, RNase and polymerase [Verrucomicrobiales bacterium]
MVIYDTYTFPRAEALDAPLTLHDPIHVVELSAQLMEGWEPVGNPFWMLLNHDVSIHPEATAIHGYTRELLRLSGYSPHGVTPPSATTPGAALWWPTI